MMGRMGMMRGMGSGMMGGGMMQGQEKTVFSSNGEKIFLKGLIQKVKLSKTHTGCRVLDAPCAMAQMQEVLK